MFLFQTVLYYQVMSNTNPSQESQMSNGFTHVSMNINKQVIQISIINPNQQVHQSILCWQREITLDKVRPPNFTCPLIFNLMASSHTAGTRLHFNLLCQLPIINTYNHDSQWHRLRGLHRVVQYMDQLIDKCYSAKFSQKFLEKDGSITLNDLLITARAQEAVDLQNGSNGRSNTSSEQVNNVTETALNGKGYRKGCFNCG